MGHQGRVFPSLLGMDRRACGEPAGSLRGACRRPGWAGPSHSTEGPLQSGAEEVSQRHFLAGRSFERHLRHVTTRQTQCNVDTARLSWAAPACGQALRGSQPGRVWAVVWTGSSSPHSRLALKKLRATARPESPPPPQICLQWDGRKSTLSRTGILSSVSYSTERQAPAGP